MIGVCLAPCALNTLFVDFSKVEHTPGPIVRPCSTHPLPQWKSLFVSPISPTVLYNFSMIPEFVLVLIMPEIFGTGRYTSINTTGVTSGAGTDYHSGAPEFTPGS